MANEKNLIPLNKRTKSQQREIAKKGGQASAKKRAEAKTSREIIEMLDALTVTGANAATMETLGIPENMRTQQTLRLLALHKRAAQGDAQANKLLLEIRGEAAASTVNLEVNTEARDAYDRAAAAIKGAKKK